MPGSQYQLPPLNLPSHAPSMFLKYLRIPKRAFQAAVTLPVGKLEEANKI